MNDEELIELGDRYERIAESFVTVGAPGGGYLQEKWIPGDICEVVGSDNGDMNTVFKNLRTGGVACGFVGMRRHPLLKWRRLPREQTLEERRAGLKEGDVIRDPALLCVGMRVRKNYPAREDKPFLDVTISDVGTADGGHLEITGDSGSDFNWFRTDAEVFTEGRVTYLGMATVAPAPSIEEAKQEECTAPPAEIPGSHRTTQPRCEPSCTPASPCRTELVCPAWKEDVISMRTAARPRYLTTSSSAAAPAYEPSFSGLGSMVGPVLSQRAGK